MQLDIFLNKKIVVTQTRGGSKLTDRQKGSLIGLGLRGIGSGNVAKWQPYPSLAKWETWNSHTVLLFLPLWSSCLCPSFPFHWFPNAAV